MPRSMQLVPLATVWSLGFVFQILWNSLIVRQNVINHAAVNIHLLFYICFGTFALLTILIFATRASWTRAVPIKSMCVAGALCMLSSSVMLSLEGLDGSFVAVVAGVAIGALGSLISMLVWGSYFKRLTIAQSISAIIAAFMLDFLFMSFSHFLLPTASTVILLIFAVCGPVCLVISDMRTTTKAQSLAEKNEKAAQAGAAAMAAGAAGATMAVAGATANASGKAKADGGNGTNGDDWLGETTSDRLFDNIKGGVVVRKAQKRHYFFRILVAFAIYALVLTLRSPVSFQTSGLAIAVLNILAFLICALLFWALIIRRAPISFERLIQTLISTFALGFFLQPFLPEEALGIPSALFFVATQSLYMLVWMAVVDVASESECHPFLIVGIWAACYGCPRLLYYVVSAFTPIGGAQSSETMLATTVLALFLLFVALLILVRQPLEAHTFFADLIKQNRAQPSAVKPQDKYREFADKHQLTARESEVFFLVCSGHSRRYIADMLFISENTVKAHLKRIYVKTDIHSKYDLEKALEPESSAADTL